jgi:hypothetical protein
MGVPVIITLLSPRRRADDYGILSGIATIVMRVSDSDTPDNLCGNACKSFRRADEGLHYLDRGVATNLSLEMGARAEGGRGAKSQAPPLGR